MSKFSSILILFLLLDVTKGLVTNESLNEYIGLLPSLVFNSTSASILYEYLKSFFSSIYYRWFLFFIRTYGQFGNE